MKYTEFYKDTGSTSTSIKLVGISLLVAGIYYIFTCLDIIIIEVLISVYSLL